MDSPLRRVDSPLRRVDSPPHGLPLARATDPPSAPFGLRPLSNRVLRSPTADQPQRGNSDALVHTRWRAG
eukprot:1192511-Prorocentrum_minimum.AAC.1